MVAPRVPRNAKTYLLSLLAQQYVIFGAEIAPKYPWPFLVWEPGTWTPPNADGSTVILTRSANADSLSQPPTGDALCYALTGTADGKAKAIKLGRAAEGDIAINDATVSREHLLLYRDSSRWVMETLPGSKVTSRANIPLKPGERVALSSGSGFKAGSVSLTFYDPQGFMDRLEQEKKKALGQK